MARKSSNILYKISEDPRTVNIYSDASDTGCEAHFQSRNTGGNWSLKEKYCHINVKEVLVVYFSLKCFAKYFLNLTMKIHVDNTAVVLILKNHRSGFNSKKHEYIPQ